MASVIVFASQKGGSGKTTLSGHIAVQAHLAGAGPVAVIDTDPQRSLAQWRYAREDNSLILKVSDVDNIEGDIEEMKALGAQTIVIDTPPAATSAIGEVVRHADLVCIPTRPSPHDLRAVGATIDIVESHRKPMIFILNSAAARARITSDAAMALSQHGTVAPAIIHNRVDFAASMTDGRSVMEVDEGSRSAEEIVTLWSYIVERLGRIYEQRGQPVPAAVLAPSAPVTVPSPAAATAEAPGMAAAETAAPAAEVAPAAADEAAPPSPVPEAPPATETPPATEAPPLAAAAGENVEPRRTPTAEEFFEQRRMIKTPTFFGPDRRRKDNGAPAGLDRRATAFGRRAS